ncbi:facilitated trehalose transporter Tret1-like isoform X1 [Diorhabda sublineata]|uniref:facilitated trehalose transporter Tret1-like isoform X1 n=2 Tax=Diorhabda sublineata TaxID=1163346 RepID=UPI0024E0F3FF|nr:facilitated trehalose transporter Tret1-like isoform X1 [Diorhabda sublineata]
MKGLRLSFFPSELRSKDTKIESQDGNVNFGLNHTLFLKQTLVALGPLLLTICSGMTFGYSAILLPQLQTLNNGTISIDKEEASWIASMAALPMALGSAFGGFFSAKLGRKRTHTLACLPTFLSWILIYLATDTKMILTGRFISGFVTGMLASVTGVYIGETSDPANRGFLLAGISFSVSLGLFLSHLLGTFLSWQNTALICSILPFLSQISMLFTPESPSWLADKGKIKEAERSFYWCRGNTEEAKKEIQIMLQRQNKQSQEENVQLDNFLEPEFWKPLGIISVYIVANQWAGINAITFYSVNIMRDTIGDEVNEYLATLIIDIMRLFMSSIACVLLKTLKRRSLALISGFGTTIPLFTLSLYTYLVKTHPGLSSGYVPLLCLICYIIFISIGFVPLPWAMMGELFPLRHRSIGSGISSVLAFLAFFSVVKCVPDMFQNYGPHGTFFTFGIVAFVGTSFVYLFLPETKGRPLHEIEDSFKK